LQSVGKVNRLHSAFISSIVGEFVGVWEMVGGMETVAIIVAEGMGENLFSIFGGVGWVQPRRSRQMIKTGIFCIK
jgi:hypothetical protein